MSLLDEDVELKVVGWVIGIMFIIIVPALLYLLFVILPVSLSAERECLAKGYPKAEITYALERYCMTIDGSVTVRVDRIK